MQFKKIKSTQNSPDLLNVVPTTFFEVVILRLRNFFWGMRVHLEREQGEAPDGNPPGRGRWGWACVQMWHPSLYCRNELLPVNPFHEQASARFHWHSHCSLAWTGTAHVITTWPGTILKLREVRRLAWSHTMGKKKKKQRQEGDASPGLESRASNSVFGNTFITTSLLALRTWVQGSIITV